MPSSKRIHTITLDCGHIRTCLSNKPGDGYYCIECKTKVSYGLKEDSKK